MPELRRYSYPGALRHVTVGYICATADSSDLRRMNANPITGPVRRAYLFQFRLRSNLHWLLGVALCFLPTVSILGIMYFSDLRLESYYYGSLAAGALVCRGLSSRMHGLEIALGRRKELRIHLPKSFVASALEKRSTLTHFVAEAVRVINWAQRSGFRTVSMDSPLLHKARRREQIASALQQALGHTVNVSAMADLRRMTFLEHWAFLLSRCMLAAAVVRLWKSVACEPRAPDPGADGLSRQNGRLMSGRITISLQPNCGR